MTYYIKLETDADDVFQYDIGILGEASQKAFYPNKGFSRLVKIINEHPDLLETLKILDDNNKSHTANQFLKKLETLTMIAR